MTLVEIRELFVTRNGRYDLVVNTTGWADNGADFFIQAGSRWLDRLEEHDHSRAKKYVTISADDWYFIFQESRAIYDVWASNAEFHKKLEYRDSKVFREYYNEIPSGMDSGVPTYWTPALLRTHPQSDTVYVARWQDDDYTETSKFDYEYNGILFMPPADEAYLMWVEGLFYSKKLTDNAHTNYWSVNHPELLLMGANYMLEINYRNTEGAKDWERSVMSILSGVGKDFVEGHADQASQ
ncbi:unnamed protein product, partial [marine sediment metagenome]